MIIEWLGLSFNSGVPDANGCLWYVTGMEGWGAVAPVTVTVKPTSQDGEIVANSTLGSRPMGLDVIMKASTEDGFWAGYNYLETESDKFIYDTSPLTVAEGAAVKQVNVVRRGEIRMRLLGGLACEISLDLTAPDPTKTTL